MSNQPKEPDDPEIAAVISAIERAETRFRHLLDHVHLLNEATGRPDWVG